MSDPGHDTRELLCRLHSGDPQALAAILERDLAWIREMVGKRLGPELRDHGESGDYVHDVVVQALKLGPRFVVADRAHFRHLLLRIVEHCLRDRIAWFRAGKRDHRIETRFVRETWVELGPDVKATTPSAAAIRAEEETWVELAMTLLATEDRRILLWRQRDDLGFAEIGQRLGVPENTARMRFVRALQRLGERLLELRRGSIAEALARSDLPP